MNKKLPQDDLQHILDHTRELWEEVRGQRIFVTGGTGFFGCWLLESFAYINEQLNLGAHLVALTRNPGAFAVKAPHLVANPAISLCEGDVRDFKFPDGGFSYVVHAGTTSSASVPPLEMFDTVIAGTRHVLDFAVACKAKKFLLTSSGAVYGKQPPEMTHIPETYAGSPDSSDPNSAYGIGKRAAELLGAIYHQEHGLEAKIARCFAFSGPHLPLDAHFAIGNFIRDALAGGPIHIKGDGTTMRSYLYAADLAIWLWTILFRGKPGHPYNTGSGHTVSIEELARMVAGNCQPPVRVVVDKQPVPGAMPARYVCDCTRAENELSLQSLICIERQIQKSISWHRESFLDKI